MAVLRRLVPETFTDADPTPFRNVVFRIAVQEVSGRAAEPGARAAQAAPDPDLHLPIPIGTS